MTKQLFGLLLLLLGFCLTTGLVPSLLADEKEDKTKKNPIVTSATKAAGTMKGKVTAVNDQGFTLEVLAGRYKQKIELLVAEDAKIRMPPEMEFDEHGKTKKLKPDLLDKDRKLGGVKGTKSDLKVKQEVQVTLGRLPNNKLVATIVQVMSDPKRGSPP